MARGGGAHSPLGVTSARPEAAGIGLLATNHAGFAVSESTVYRVLKRYGLIRPVTVRRFPAGREYWVKPTRINEQWRSDGSYFFVVGWGWYYLISVLDDLSRFIVASDFKPDLTATSISDVVLHAAEWTGLPQARWTPPGHRPRLGLSGAARPRPPLEL